MTDVQPRSIAALLGIKSRAGAFSFLDLANEVAKGLSALAVDRVCGMIAPAEPALRYKVVSRATLARRQASATSRLSREESDRVARLARLWTFATDVWGSEQEARRFLAEPHPLLGGRVPRDVAIETEIGARAVEDLLGRLKYGSAA